MEREKRICREGRRGRGVEKKGSKTATEEESEERWVGEGREGERGGGEEQEDAEERHRERERD